MKQSWSEVHCRWGLVVLVMAVGFVLPSEGWSQGRPMRVWSVEPIPGQDAITPMVRVSRGPAGTLTAAEAARKVIEQVERAEFRAPGTGEWALFISHDLPGAFDRRRLSVNLEGHVAWYEEFWRRVSMSGHRPDLIVLDQEGGIGPWQVLDDEGVPGGDRVGRARHVWAHLPAHITLGRQPEQAATVHVGRDLYLDWDQWAAEVRAWALREAVLRTAERAYGDVPLRISNYGDMPRRGEVQGLFPWPAVMTGDRVPVASPVLYLNTTRFNRYQGIANAAELRLRDTLALARACMVEGVEVVPWIGTPVAEWNGDPDTWVEQIKLLRQMGIREFLLYNPDPRYNRHFHQDNQAVVEVFGGF